LTRRFYLRPTAPPIKSRAVRIWYPRWFIPVLVIVGAGLGLMVYWLTCTPNENQAQVNRDPAQQSTTFRRKPNATPMRQAADTDRTEGALTDARRRSFEGLRIQVLNGCGVKGLARMVTPGLRSFGFDVRETRNAANFDHKASAIIDRTGDLEMARIVADSLGVDAQNVSTRAAPNLVDIDITLIVGADYRRLNLNLGDLTQE
jgi:hypothetical protein